MRVAVPGPARAITVDPDAGGADPAGDRSTVVADASTNTYRRVIHPRMAWGIAAAPGTARQRLLAENNGSITRLHG